MNNNENKIQKVCSLYVNDWHLTTMLLPHINSNIKSNTKVLTLFQNGIKNNIEELLSKINLNTSTKEQILEINWTSKSACNSNELKNELKNIDNNVSQIEIIVNGSNEYMVMANTCIENAFADIPYNVRIVNCYETSTYDNLNEILDMHDFVLNTSGIKHISDVFTDYKRPDTYCNRDILHV